ncbi:MAG: O-antigen ligase family protein [Sphingomonadaceae bacterium]
MTHRLLLWLVPAYLALCLALGGASAGGFWENMLLQLTALAIIGWSLLHRRSGPGISGGRILYIVSALTVLLILVQLIPLPPALWTTLPEREQVARGFEILDLELPPLPLSLAPYETIESALWLLPALAVFLGMTRLGAFRPALIGWTITTLACLGVLVGALQLAGGRESFWYFYDITNYGAATGFFSNANHMATLLVATLPFIAALYLDARNARRSMKSVSGALILLAGAAGMVIVGILLNGSLAGLGLFVPVFGACLFMLFSRRATPPIWMPVLLALLFLASVYLIFNPPFGSDLLSVEGETELTRRAIFARTIEAARDFFPIGSGIGTFREVYAIYENPAAISHLFVNHAHNDYLELALETGLPGIILLGLFMIWWTSRGIAIWRDGEIDYFARAATVASAAILAHSLVDYPLRTAAIGALFAACCALMAGARPRAKRARKKREARQPRHLSAD